MRLTTIKQRGDFLQASAKGKKFITGTFILQMFTRPATHPAGKEARYGFTVTKKMGNAVIRNRIKRRLREAARRVGPQHALAENDYVMISRHKAIDCPFADLLRDMEFAFSRISSMKDDKSKFSNKAPEKKHHDDHHQKPE
jgi:ribonuclease P protein component